MPPYRLRRIFADGVRLKYVLRIWTSVEDPARWRARPRLRRVAFALRPLMIVYFLAFAPSDLGFVFGIDLRVLRIFRLFRPLRLARYSQAPLGVVLAERMRCSPRWFCYFQA